MCRKKFFATKTEADRFLVTCQERGYSSRRSYWHDACFGWHLTSKPVADEQMDRFYELEDMLDGRIALDGTETIADLEEAAHYLLVK